MKAAQWFGQRDIRVVDVPEPPAPGPGQIKVKTAFCGICGTDLHEYLEGPMYVPYDKPHPLGDGKMVPITLGHESTGTVVEVGPGVTNVKTGDRIAVDCCLSCGECDMCRQGQYQVCENIGFVGLHTDGAFAEYFLCPAERANIIPDSMSFETATVIEPMAVAMHAIRQANVLTGDRVVILGAGAIGMSALLNARAAGASEIYVIEKSRGRAKKAMENGATAVFNPLDGDVLQMVLEATHGGADRVIECIGNDISGHLAIQCAHFRGTICIAGGYVKPSQVHFFDIANTERVVVGSLCYNHDFERCIKLVKNGMVDIDRIISGKILLDDIVKKGFQEITSNPEPYIKVLVTPWKDLL